MRRFLAALILLGQAATITCYLRNIKKLPAISLSRGCRHSSSLFVVEHLVDCAAHPEIAEVYGALANDFCLQTTDSSATIFRGLGGFVEQAATIGFLVMSYFFFKRTANGISEWEDDDDEEDMSPRDNDSDTDISQGKESRRCPQCNGRGKFEFDGNADSAPMCDLCGGSGSIIRSVRAKTLGLPISSRKLWSDESNDEDERMQ
jgi:hypothetical protein